MDVTRFDEANLLVALEQMPPHGRASFAAACAQRLAPVFLRNCKDSARLHDFRIAMESLWKDLTGEGPQSSGAFEALARNMEKAIPPDDAPDPKPQDAYLEDAAAATVYALRCRVTGDVQMAAWAAGCCYEAVDRFSHISQEIDFDEPDAEHRILAHPIVQQELRLQASFLRTITLSKDPRAIAAALQQQAMNNPLSLDHSGPGAARVD